MGELHYFLGVSVEHTWIGQPAYTQAMIKKFCLNLWARQEQSASDESETVDEILYQSASLLYLSGPDIAFAKHWTAVKRILRWTSSKEQCLDISDADWAGDISVYLWVYLHDE